MIADILVLGVILLLISAAVGKIIVDRKNGIMCTGCPHSKVCAKQSTCQGENSEANPFG